MIYDFKASVGWECTWFVARASYRPGEKLKESGSRGGQRIIWEQGVALPGPDTDKMLGTLRDFEGKGIHFSKEGLSVHGKAWAQLVGDYLEKTMN